jgi:parallel beta-helix repeat protein
MSDLKRWFCVRCRSVTTFAVIVGVLGGLGCGGGSSGGSGGSLNFRPVWEQRSLRSGTGATASGQSTSVTRGSFGPDLPAAVKTVRIAFDSDAGLNCCLAVDPTSLPIDPVSGRHFLVLDQLPAGGATVTLAGFAVNFAPIANAVAACPTDPPGAGQTCDATRVAPASFLSDPQRVSIVGGTETTAGDIPVFAVPFVFNLNPDIGGNVVNPVTATFTVADAASGIDSQSVSYDIAGAASATLTLTACDDATNTPCSSGGALQVAGFKVIRQAQTLDLGDAEAHIGARNLATAPRTLDFSYPFSVQATLPTPTPTGTPTGDVLVVHSGASIGDIARAARAGSTLFVEPGVYGPIALRAGDLRGPITLIADVNALRSDSPAAPVTISVRGNVPGIRLSGLSNVTIDGFSVRGGVGAGVVVEQSTAVAVQNCLVTGTRGDGVRFDGSSSVLALDNLVFGNSGSGILVRGSSDVRLINNTLYQNQAAGISVGETAQPSDAITLRNNILNLNTPVGLTTDLSTSGYDADFNLNTDGYGADTPQGVDDIIGNVANPLFIAPAREDFHLARGLSGSQSPAVDAGDPEIDAEVAAALGQRTTQTDGSADMPPVDLGYHYPAVLPTPTPLPRG